MTILTEGPHHGGFLVWEVLRDYTRETVTLASGAGKLAPGTVFMNRADYLDPGLCWTGCKDTGRGGGLSVIGYHNLTRPKSYHLKKA